MCLETTGEKKEIPGIASGSRSRRIPRRPDHSAITGLASIDQPQYYPGNIDRRFQEQIVDWPRDIKNYTCKLSAFVF